MPLCFNCSFPRGAVNTASRLESNSEAGRINLSETAAAQLRRMNRAVRLSSRGVIDIKGKGSMHCYFLDQARAPAARSALAARSLALPARPPCPLARPAFSSPLFAHPLPFRRSARRSTRRSAPVNGTRKRPAPASAGQRRSAPVSAGQRRSTPGNAGQRRSPQRRAARRGAQDRDNVIIANTVRIIAEMAPIPASFFLMKGGACTAHLASLHFAPDRTGKIAASVPSTAVPAATRRLRTRIQVGSLLRLLPSPSPLP